MEAYYLIQVLGRRRSCGRRGVRASSAGCASGLRLAIISGRSTSGTLRHCAAHFVGLALVYLVGDVTSHISSSTSSLTPCLMAAGWISATEGWYGRQTWQEVKLNDDNQGVKYF